jgi:hypothetical protein
MTSKKLTPIRLNQIGSFYNFPNWRYLIYLEPHRANLEHCRKKPNDGSSRLRRYIDQAAQPASVSFSFSSFFSRSLTRLNSAQRDLFYKLFNKKLKLQGDRKIFVPTYSEEVGTWSAKHIALIVDAPLRNFLYHAARIRYSKDYEFAVKFRNSPEHQRSFCVVGYCIFAGLSDTLIAYRHKLRVGQVKALRELFFDFTNAPTDVIARAAYFTQLTDNQIISDVDRRYFKIIGSLGELGLKADADPSSLTNEEKERLNSFLADSMLDNVTSIYFSIEDKKDALAYNTVINNLASFCIKKEEIKYFQAKVKHLDATTSRIVNERTNYDTSMQEEDVLAIELISQLALKENSLPEYKVITQLN